MSRLVFLSSRFISLLLFLGASCNLPAAEHSPKTCVVFVSNKKYFPKFLGSLEQLVKNGKYHGDICLVIGDDLLSDNYLKHPLLRKNRVIVKHFPDLSFPPAFMEAFKKVPPAFTEKIFQYHKLYLFDTYFKSWKTIFYIDSGVTICRDIRPMLSARKADTLLAHSDAYPAYEWKLSGQFNPDFPERFSELSQTYNLNIDYFQTTVMLYDTSIIQKDTFQNLYDLAVRYPISRTNDQAIIALYFTNIVPVWEQIPLKNKDSFFYDYSLRSRPPQSFIMFKSY